MLNASNVTLSFGGRNILNEVTFVVNPKERIGLIGRNGQGKSTLLKILADRIKPDSGIISTSKEYSVGYLPQEGGSKSDLPLKKEVLKSFEEVNRLKQRINDLNDIISQREDYESEEYLKIVTELSEASDRLAFMNVDSMEANVERILLGLGFLRTDFFKLCNEFSGGWQMRIELAKILLKNPDLILLDEPTNHLDIESIIWLEKFLNNYFGAVIIVSHDKRFLDNVTNRTIEILNGNIYDKKFPYSKFLEQRKIDIELQKNAKANQERQKKEIEKYVDSYRAKARHASRVQSKIKKLEKMEEIEVDEMAKKKISFHFPKPPRSGRLVAEAKDVEKTFDENTVFKHIDFAIERGEKVAFVGKNGMGKSTLSKILAGELIETDGEVFIGSNVELGYFRQDQAQVLNENSTVLNVIYNAASDDMRPYTRDLLGAFLFSGDDVDKKVRVLSGGERSRLALAKLLLEPINFLIMDEPTNHLDIPSKEILKDALKNYKGALIIVSHDRDFLKGLTEKTIEFRNGNIIEYLGDIDYFLSKRNFDDVAEIDLEKVSKETNTSESEEKTDSQEHRQARKEKQRETKKLQKLSEKKEIEVETLESEIKKLNKLFSKPEVYENKNKMIELKEKLNQLKSNLDKSMEEWSEAQIRLEEITD